MKEPTPDSKKLIIPATFLENQGHRIERDGLSEHLLGNDVCAPFHSIEVMALSVVPWPWMGKQLEKFSSGEELKPETLSKIEGAMKFAIDREPATLAACRGFKTYRELLVEQLAKDPSNLSIADQGQLIDQIIATHPKAQELDALTEKIKNAVQGVAETSEIPFQELKDDYLQFYEIVGMPEGRERVEKAFDAIASLYAVKDKIVGGF
jgi:hypothetical protein